MDIYRTSPLDLSCILPWLMKFDGIISATGHDISGTYTYYIIPFGSFAGATLNIDTGEILPMKLESKEFLGYESGDYITITIERKPNKETS